MGGVKVLRVSINSPYGGCGSSREKELKQQKGNVQKPDICSSSTNLVLIWNQGNGHGNVATAEWRERCWR